MREIITIPQAIAEGLRFYFNGKPCHKGHISERYVKSGKCLQCAKDEWKKVQSSKPEKLVCDKLEPTEFELAEKKLIAIVKRQIWLEDNVELRRDHDRKWRKENPDKVRANLKALSKRNKVRRPPWVNRKHIRDIYFECPDGYEVDHIVPLNGENVSGLHVPWNLQYLPKSENRKKRNKWPYDIPETAIQPRPFTI